MGYAALDSGMQGVLTMPAMATAMAAGHAARVAGSGALHAAVPCTYGCCPVQVRANTAVLLARQHALLAGLPRRCYIKI
jgi:hypothetical protein